MGSPSENPPDELKKNVEFPEKDFGGRDFPARATEANVDAELYRALFAASREGVLVVDDAGFYVEVNDAYARLLKTTRYAVVGRHFSEFMPAGRLSEAQAAFDSMKSGGAGLAEFPIQATDGTLVDCEWTSQSHFLPGLTLCCARAITERKQVEEALRTSNERLRLAAEAGNVGLWDWDIQTGHLAWSDRMYDFHGVDPSSFEATAKAFEALVHPADRERVAASISDTLAGTNPSHFEFRTVRPNGEVRWLSTSGRVFHNAEGMPIRMLGTTIDITERRADEQALLRSNEQLEEFAYAVSHDLQEPLRTISIYAPLLVERFVSEDPTARKYSEFIQQAAARMETLIGDLLNYSRVIHLGSEPPGVVDLQNVLSQTLDVLREPIQTSGAVIEIDRLPPVVGNESQISLVFQNLISNAVKYRREDRRPHLQIRVLEGDPGFVTICVSDNGIGFDPAYREVIFGLFKRLHGSAYSGTGLGLAICRRILVRHGGAIWADSEPGIGSKFFFKIPSA